MSLPFPKDRQVIIGSHELTVAILARGLFNARTVNCSYDPTPRKWPIRIQERIDLVRTKQTGAYDGKLFSVRSFGISTNRIYGIPVDMLNLSFGPTTYFEQLATDLSRDLLFKSGLYYQQDATSSPIPNASTILGLNLTLLTRDGRIAITQRSNRTAVATGQFHTSMGSNVPRLLEQPPDLFTATVNALKEELGIEVSAADIEFRTLTVNADGQYSLMGTLRIHETRQDLELLRMKGTLHGWENKSVYYFHADDLPAITRFLEDNWNKFYPVGLVSILFSLLDLGYSMECLQAAFHN